MVKITCSREQARTMLSALDFYSRIIMGQFDEFENVMRWHSEYWQNPAERRYLEDCLEKMRDIVYPELKGYAHWGIYNENCPEESKKAFDILQVLRHALAWNESPKGGVTVSFNKPLPSGVEKLCQVEIDDSIEF